MEDLSGMTSTNHSMCISMHHEGTRVELFEQATFGLSDDQNIVYHVNAGSNGKRQATSNSIKPSPSKLGSRPEHVAKAPLCPYIRAPLTSSPCGSLPFE